MKYTLFRNTYLHQVERDWVAVYNSLAGHALLFLRRDRVKELETFRHPRVLESTKLEAIAAPLIENRFLLPESFDQNAPIDRVAQHLSKKPSISLMYLLVTSQCNLRCSYCFIENEHSRPQYNPMTSATCLNAVDFFARVVDRNSARHTVIFYGGEPLLNPLAVKQGCIRLRELERAGSLNELTIIVNTNATVVDSSWAEFFRTYRITPSVSIDGTKEIHDDARRTVAGGPTFDRSLKGFKILKEAGLPIGISCTISEPNVGHLETVARFFVDLSPTGIGFNPLIGRAYQDAGDALNRATVPALVRAFEILRESGIYEDRVMRRLKRITKKELYTKECAAYGNQVVISPDGEIGPCHGFLGMSSFFSGNVNTNPIVPGEDSLFLQWNERTPFKLEECARCPFIGICGGGCAYTAYLCEGSILKPDPRMYDFCQLFLDWVIEDMWKSHKYKIAA